MTEHDEWTDGPELRVPDEWTPQHHAENLRGRIDTIRRKVLETPSETMGPEFPVHTFNALLLDTESMLEGVQTSKITSGCPRIRDNVIEAIAILDASPMKCADTAYALTSVVGRLSQTGITVAGSKLTGVQVSRSGRSI